MSSLFQSIGYQIGLEDRPNPSDPVCSSITKCAKLVEGKPETFEIRFTPEAGGQVIAVVRAGVLEPLYPFRPTKNLMET